MKPNSCTYPDCGRPVTSRGLCQTHYWQERRGEELRPIKFKTTKERRSCSFLGCEQTAYAKDLCVSHRKQQLRGHDLTPITRGIYAECTVEGCNRKVASRGHCQTHAKYRNAGKELKPIVKDYAYRYAHSPSGYVTLYLPDHPNAGKNGMVLEHVKVMSDILGRSLIKGENVHHRNGQRDDNRPENLELWVTQQPKGQRAVDLLADARRVIAVYEAVEDKL